MRNNYISYALNTKQNKNSMCFICVRMCVCVSLVLNSIQNGESFNKKTKREVIYIKASILTNSITIRTL